ELSLFEGGQNALLAYVFARSAWGSGYATEACGAALTYVRAHAPRQTVSALIATRNARSIALVTRLGFVCAETIRDADHFKGRASHEYRYCLHLGTTVLSI
ncbi:MAG: GNAT family N-acetyltransferase, partial [Candidatus Eremiobacteraeota bacterium]|nr:GNAT family N-acetyltransferase [Candidatus Eremiobacteraeota bacterium]